MNRQLRYRLDRALLIPIACLLSIAWAGSAGAQVASGEGMREGRGEYEMVLIHGLGSSAMVWDGLAPYLMGTFKVLRFELAGHGETRPMPDPTIAGEVLRLHEFLQANDLPRPTLVGHGLGGMIALQYGLDHPADVDRLILMDAAPRQLVGAEAKVEITQQMLEDYDRFVAERYLNMSPEADITDQILDQALRTDSASFISLLMSSFDYDVTDRLRGMSVPMLIVGSELMFPQPEENRQVLDQIGFGEAPSLSFKRMGMTGHFMMLERPVYIASVVLAFAAPAGHQFGE